jgi:flavin-dependent dehydrogenase
VSGASGVVDVAIIGGGPAGASTALHLVREQGIHPASVLLLDKATHPREKPCAGAVSAWGLDALSRIDVPLSVPHVPMRGLRVVAGGGASGDSACPSLGAVVRRSEFDASLFFAARAEGVRAYDGEELVGLARAGGVFRLRTTRREIDARLVAACDGAGSRVRKLLGIAEHARKGHLYVLETPPVPHDAGRPEGFCEFDLSPSDDGLEGYYWDFPTVIAGERAVSRGIYHANFTARRDVKEKLARALARRGVDIARCTLKPFSTRPFTRGALLWQPGLLLVGEAAGIDATTGEGIAQAILFGALAARHLARALRTGHARFPGYARDVAASRMGRHLLQSAWLARRAYGPRGAAWRRFLARSEAARAAGAAWYEGRPLSWATKGSLAAGLLPEILRG